jgi:hypothetical protein
MIHIENASVAGRAMMTSFRFKYVAHQAITSSFVFWITQVETPKDWYLAWISGHNLEEGPH